MRRPFGGTRESASGWQLERWNQVARHEFRKSQSRPKSKQDKSKPAPEGPFRKEMTPKNVARTAKPRRSRAFRATGAVAALIAEREERDAELAGQIPRSFEWRRRSKARVENDLDDGRSEKRVRITVTLVDGLIRTAQSYTGIEQKSALIQTALTQLIEREAARRLAAMGETMPELKEVARRRVSAK